MKFHYRDIAHHVKEMKKDSDYSKENRAKEYLYNTNKKLEIFLPAITPVQVPSATGPINKDEASFKAGDYMYLLERVFPESTRDTNLLLNRGNTAKDYTLENVGPS